MTAFSVDDIKLKLKEELISNYQQQLKIFESHYNNNYNKLHNNQEVDPFKLDIMNNLFKNLNQHF